MTPRVGGRPLTKKSESEGSHYAHPSVQLGNTLVHPLKPLYTPLKIMGTLYIGMVDASFREIC